MQARMEVQRDPLAIFLQVLTADGEDEDGKTLTLPLDRQRALCIVLQLVYAADIRMTTINWICSWYIRKFVNLFKIWKD